MLREAGKLNKCKLGAVDGEIGKVKDFYFDDRFWTVRYLVADTGNWLTGRLVLISPYAVASVEEDDKIIGTRLTMQQIEDSPAPEADLPVSRQFEMQYHDYYRWPYYWYGPYAWAMYPNPVPVVEPVTAEEKESWDSHLRSVDEVEGYRVGALDDHIGHISDFIIDDESWAIRYLVIDTRDWLPGKHVLLSPGWTTDVDWASRTVTVDLTADAIKHAPEYDRDTPITRDYEVKLFSHYALEGYWGGGEST